MPIRPPHPCAKPGCPNLVSEGQYCTEHAHLAGQRDRERGNSTERGYGGAWPRIRRMALARDPICPLCLLEGRTHISEHVHHLNHDSHDNRAENLLAMCEAHHDSETAGNKKTLALIARVLRERGL